MSLAPPVGVSISEQRTYRLLFVGISSRERGRDGEDPLPQNEVHLLLKNCFSEKIKTFFSRPSCSSFNRCRRRRRRCCCSF